MDNTALIQAFHLMWDNFPGMARLINKKHIVIAANRIAEEKGYVAGSSCAKAPAPDMHRDCKTAAALKSGQPQMHVLRGDSLRGWIPVERHPDVLVNFVVMLPDAEHPLEP